MSVFDELLAIKRFREGKAEISVTQQRQTYAHALAAQQQAQLRLDDYQAHALALEANMYRDLCSRVVQVRAIDDVLLIVAGLKEGERQKVRELEAAVVQTKRDALALENAREHHQRARRTVEKFIELSRTHDESNDALRERSNDLEMEEAASVSREREQWAHHEEVEST